MIYFLCYNPAEIKRDNSSSLLYDKGEKMKSIQHKLLHIAFCLSIGFSIAQANFPVIDVSSIAQSIMQYTQMVREFTKYSSRG